jgi:hypothetical protein
MCCHDAFPQLQESDAEAASADGNGQANKAIVCHVPLRVYHCEFIL